MSHFDEAGFDRDGFNRFGRDAAGYDRDGFHADGLNRAGLTRAEAYLPEVVSVTEGPAGSRTTTYRCHWRGTDYRETVRRDTEGREVFAGNTNGLKMWTTYNANGDATYHDTDPAA